MTQIRPLPQMLYNKFRRTDNKPCHPNKTLLRHKAIHEQWLQLVLQSPRNNQMDVEHSKFHGDSNNRVHREQTYMGSAVKYLFGYQWVLWLRHNHYFWDDKKYRCYIDNYNFHI